MSKAPLQHSFCSPSSSLEHSNQENGMQAG
jgi:hypothetical protein